MKTSNKLLLLAFAVILIGMIAFNFALKKDLKEIKMKQGIEINQEKSNTINSDSVSININL